MNVEVIVRIDGREVASLEQVLPTGEALDLEEQTERLKDRLGQVVLEVGFTRLADELRHPCCCGKRMENKGRRCVTIASLSGKVVLERRRYRCRMCGDWQTPADAVICCGAHRMTRHLSKLVCQPATVEHFTRLEQLMADQHGVHLGHDSMMKLVHEVGGVAEAQRLAEVRYWRELPPDKRPWPEAEITPARVHVSCDGVMYCTNECEPDPQHPGSQRLIWKQMRVGCVYWQDACAHWHKRVIWGQEDDYLSFATSLYRLACRCGYRHAAEKVFAADGGDRRGRIVLLDRHFRDGVVHDGAITPTIRPRRCWSIHNAYFADAEGLLDWYHASGHVWECGQALHADSDHAAAWVDKALSLMAEQGGEGLLNWLLAQRPALRRSKCRTLDRLIHSVQPRLGRMDYPRYRAQDWPIGSGMIESTGKQLVGGRLKGPGMHWCPHGATAITALRAQDLNHSWHAFWKTLVL